MGNQMLVFNPSIAASPDGSHMVAENVVDAHTLPGISMESIIQQAPAAMQVRAGVLVLADNADCKCRKLMMICKVQVAMPPKELALRRQIATKVLITMGAKIYHFEKDIDPRDGTIDIDWEFAPAKEFHDDPSDETRIKSHAVLRIYSEHTLVKPDDTPATGSYYDTPDSKFCYLLGCEIIDLKSLMQRSIDVNRTNEIIGLTSLVQQQQQGIETSGDATKADYAKQREYDFAVQTNFCNTFCICSVVPFSNKLSHAELQKMQEDLDSFHMGLKAYEQEEAAAKKEKRHAVHDHHSFKPSVLRYLFVCVVLCWRCFACIVLFPSAAVVPSSRFALCHYQEFLNSAYASQRYARNDFCTVSCETPAATKCHFAK